MFVRDKRIGPYTYVYLVENVREGGRTKQRIIANLGRKEMVVARGDLDHLARSVARLAQRSMVLSLGEAPPNAAFRRIGPALLFERLWQELGCRAVLTALAGQRQFAFAAERAVFLTVLHRLFVSGSDRAADKWRADYRIDGTEGLQLHHLYRAMGWLGEPLAPRRRVPLEGMSRSQSWSSLRCAALSCRSTKPIRAATTSIWAVAAATTPGATDNGFCRKTCNTSAACRRRIR